jgi:HAD superfamily hydrolase (TIGR01509 family)
MLKLVIFDMDGTIIDTDLLVTLAWVKMYQKYRPDYKPSLSKIIYFSGPPIGETAPQEFPDEDPKKVLRYFTRICKKLYDQYAVAYPGLTEVLAELKARGIKTAVNTNKLHYWAEYALKVSGLEHSFDYLVAGGDAPTMKPDPAGVYLAMARAGVKDKDEVLYVGDTIYDLETARNAGIGCLLVTWTPRKLPTAIKPRYYLDSYSHFFEVIDGKN